MITPKVANRTKVGSIELMVSENREQKRVGWEMAVRIEKIIATVLDEAHRQQVEETMETLVERSEGFYE